MMRLPSAVFVSAACLAALLASGDDYPARWWQPIAEADHQWWEIVPQQAAPGELVLSKRNELGIFSNFAQTPFYFHGQRYESVEGFWYMLAYPEGAADPRRQDPAAEWKHTREEVSGMVGFEAKAAGALAEANMAALGINWVSFEGRRFKYWSHVKGEHYRLIRQAIWEKLRQNPAILELLLATGDLKLIPDNFDSLRDLPAWRYFDILAELRDAQRSGSASLPSARYPEHWWRPVPEQEKQAGEVLPQAAGPGELILSRRNELGIFSSFEREKGEHAPRILAAMRAELEQNPELGRLLLATGELRLRPDHQQEPNAPQDRGYHEIWMEIRSELQAQQRPVPRVVRTDGSLVDF